MPSSKAASDNADQPPMQRVSGRGELAVRQVNGRSGPVRLFQEGAAKIRLPRTAGKGLEAVIINTAGGLTGGDRLDWQVEAAEHADVTVTTPAAERIYRTIGGLAEISVSLNVSNGASLRWLPQETILFDNCALRRRIDVDLAGDARLLMLEATIFGRKAMGETVRQAEFRDRWRIRHEGRLIHAEEVRLEGDIAGLLARRAVANGGLAMATLLMAGPRTDAAARALAPAREGMAISHWSVAGTGKLLARLVATDGYALRRRLAGLFGLLKEDAALPKNWSI